MGKIIHVIHYINKWPEPKERDKPCYAAFTHPGYFTGYGDTIDKAVSIAIKKTVDNYQRFARHGTDINRWYKSLALRAQDLPCYSEEDLEKLEIQRTNTEEELEFRVAPAL